MVLCAHGSTQQQQDSIIGSMRWGGRVHVWRLVQTYMLAALQWRESRIHKKAYNVKRVDQRLRTRTAQQESKW